MKWIRRLLYTAVIIMTVMVGGRYWMTHMAAQHVADAPMGQFIGPADAEQVIVEFMDYRCAACRATAPAIKDFHEKHPDVKIVFRHLPVFGKPSIQEARLALGAGLSGKFIEMHNLLITRENPVKDEEIDLLARIVGIEPEKLRTDMIDYDVTKQVLLGVSAVDALKIKSTPSFLINGKVFSSTFKIPDADDLYRVLMGDEEIEAKTEKN